MTKYYCYFNVEGDFSPSTKVFKIPFGDSPRDMRKKRVIDLRAVRSGAFFRIWDWDTEVILRQRACRFEADSHLSPLVCNIIQISLNDFYRRFLNDSLDTAENPAIYLINRARLAPILSPKYFLNSILPQTRKLASASPRKNLSNSKQECRQNVGCLIVLIIALFLFAAWLEGLEQSLIY